MSQDSTTRSTGGRLGESHYEVHRAHQIVHNVMALYGEDAPTMAAWCALEAWCEDDKEEYDFWIGIFQRLRN